MNVSQVWAHGVLQPDGTLVLKERPQLPAGPVEVLLRTTPLPHGTSETWLEFLERTRQELQAQGHTFRTKEEIKSDRARMRSMDEQRRQANQQARE